LGFDQNEFAIYNNTKVCRKNLKDKKDILLKAKKKLKRDVYWGDVSGKHG
jgi:hypothetical protein